MSPVGDYSIASIFGLISHFGADAPQSVLGTGRVHHRIIVRETFSRRVRKNSPIVKFRAPKRFTGVDGRRKKLRKHRSRSYFKKAQSIVRILVNGISLIREIPRKFQLLLSFFFPGRSQLEYPQQVSGGRWSSILQLISNASRAESVLSPI